MSNFPYKRGDLVKVQEPGFLYPEYDRMAEQMGLTRWKLRSTFFMDNDEQMYLTNHTFSVVAVARHHSYPLGTDDCEIVVAIEEHPSARQYLIEAEGLELVDKQDNHEGEQYNTYTGRWSFL